MLQSAILVTGATGLQGGAVVDALLAQGVSVRALVRDDLSQRAAELAARGVELAKGDFDDIDSLKAALKGVGGVFSVQLPPFPPDENSELRAARNLIEAARAADVETIVHTSVARAGDQKNFVGWNERRWWNTYWDSKSGANDMVRAAGFPHWIILKPAILMANYLPPKAHVMWPELRQRGAMVTVIAPNTLIDLIDPTDVGKFAAAAFIDPARFNGQEIDLASESLTMSQVAVAIAQATGKSVTVEHFTVEEALARGMHLGVVQSEEWDNVEGYKVDLKKSASYGIKLSRFAEFAQRHAAEFIIGN